MPGRAKASVVPMSLKDDWHEYLSLRQPGFDWTGADYSRPDRNQAPDRAGLQLYTGPLQKLLAHAPEGFPTHSSLRDVFIKCDEDWKIFGGNSKNRFQAARDASAVWRKMCKDVHDIAKSGVIPDSLAAVCALIRFQGKPLEDVTESNSTSSTTMLP